MRRLLVSAGLALALVALCGSPAIAQPGTHHTGTFPKYSQPIDHVIDPLWPEHMLLWGENIPSDIDWMHSMQSPTAPPNWVIADDFRDQYNLPVITVRWWGSYLPQGQVVQHVAGGPPVPIPPAPGVEDGYLISFFKDIPGPRFNPAMPTTDYSRPGDLLGSYVLPYDKIRVKPTPYQGWDMHPIYEYEADLWAGHLDHRSDYAQPDGFHQLPGEIYWLSIVAEVGHKIELVPDGTGGPDQWQSTPSGKEAFSHYWGWHTSPLERFDVATMGHLFMPPTLPPNPTIWEYEGWMPIQPQHYLYDMAFELLTVPEPTGVGLAAVAVTSLGLFRRRGPMI